MDDVDDKEKKWLLTAPRYDMLLNKLYTEPFGYVPSFLKGRLSYIASEEYEMIKVFQHDIKDFWR